MQSGSGVCGIPKALKGIVICTIKMIRAENDPKASKFNPTKDFNHGPFYEAEGSWLKCGN